MGARSPGLKRNDPALLDPIPYGPNRDPQERSCLLWTAPVTIIGAGCGASSQGTTLSTCYAVYREIPRESALLCNVMKARFTASGNPYLRG